MLLQIEPIKKLLIEIDLSESISIDLLNGIDLFDKTLLKLLMALLFKKIEIQNNVQ